MISLMSILLVVSLIATGTGWIWLCIESYRQEQVLTLLSVLLCCLIWIVPLTRHWPRLRAPFALAVSASFALLMCAAALATLNELSWAQQVASGQLAP